MEPVSVTDPAPRECEVCHRSFTGRAGALTCSARCRQRKRRRYISPADRAALDRVWARAEPCPLPELTPEQIRAHILATARRS